MTSKRVKAWAVVDECGNLCPTLSLTNRGSWPFATYETRKEARKERDTGERVVPVTIVWEEK